MRITICVLIMIVVLINIDVFAEPCPCEFGAPGSPAKGLRDMDVIFIGKVTAIDETKEAQGLFDVMFETNKWYKGNKEEDIVVRTPKDMQNCGYNFENGQTYLVYAKNQDKALFTEACSRTRTIREASASGDINTLNLLVYGNQAGVIEIEDQGLENLDSRLKNALKADFVFVGTVLGIEESKDVQDMLNVKLQVNKVYTSNAGIDPEVVICTPKNGGIDFTLSKDKSYVVYANYHNGVLYTDKNSKTKTIEKAARDGDLDVLDSQTSGMFAYGKDISQVYPIGNQYQNRLPNTDALWDAIKKLVLTYYRQAQFIVTKDHLVFEYDTRYFTVEDVTRVGPQAYTKVIKGPKKDGILGDISLVYTTRFDHDNNEYWDKLRLGSRIFPEFTITSGNKESKKYSCYLHLILITPNEEGAELKDSMAKLIENFESYF